MSTRNSLLLALAAALPAAWGQAAPELKVNLAKDSPLTLISADLGQSRTETRGSALVLDLHTALTLRNAGPRRVRGVTLLVQAQSFTAGGKGSVTVPSLDVRPGESFPVHVDLRLLRPLMAGAGPVAEVTIDGVLFDDLSFYGDNKLNSRRLMTAWELEARRDRKHLKSVLEAKGPEGLRQEMLETLARLADARTLDVQMVRRGRVTAVAAAERDIRFAFLQLPGEPVEPVSGLARVVANEARGPRIEVRNRSDRPVRYFEIGWIIQDRDGKQYLAGSVPASDSGLALAPGAKSEIAPDAALKFSQQSRPIAIEAMTGYVSQVEFTDGSMWIPSRPALDDPRLRAVLAPSPEEQRLADLYNKRGLAALVNELRKF